MILIDYSGVAFSCALELVTSMKEHPTTDLLRHLILNSLRAITSRYKGTYGPDVVIAMDGGKYWRKDVFPHYKYKRKEQRESSGQDWSTVFQLLEPLKSEFKVSLPYKVIQVDEAEADDVIGFLTRKYAPHQSILIVSSDKDFIQLHSYGTRVLQYSPAKKTMIGTTHPTTYLKELILTGDKGDGVPNVLSVDETFVKGIRQKPLTEKRMKELMSLTPDHFAPEVLRNYKRNQQLIDLACIPDSIIAKIDDAYERATPASKQDLLAYLIEHRCGELAKCIQEF